MNLDLGSFAYGGMVLSGGNTPSWGTSLGQSQPDYKFTYTGAENILIGMIYCTTPLQHISLPLGKGGRIYKASDTSECQLASLFKKVYINEIYIDYPFLMVLIREESASHTGRRTIKYSDKIAFNDDINQYNNTEFIKKAKAKLGLTEGACWFVYSIEIKSQDELHMYAIVVDANNPVSYPDSQSRRKKWLELLAENDKDFHPTNSYCQNDKILQQIFYGAPGTGKSNTIKKEVDEKKKICFRTTFHPDSDYSTFVGCYKPKMKVQPLYNQQTGAKIGEEKKIAYTYIPQAFTKAYVKAWQNPTEPVYLIIEEINRGNCAQIFGDIFQLLDRNDQGLSDYPIKADDDLKAHLYECFISNDNLPENIKSGEELQLPSNLYIWATMNTSDQSLFPIDSAFKRRWDWTYIPIYDAKKGWKIEVNGKRYGWWSFLEKINEKIGTTTSSEDKKLGYFFCKADDNGIISAEKFVGKVIFYLWNDVFKDYAEDSSVFVDEANKAITFDKFYMADSEGRAIVATNMVETFLKNLVVEADTSIEKGEEISSTNTTITVNGKAVKYVNAIPYTTIEEYKILHPNKTAQEIIDVWKDFSKYSMRTWIVCNKDEHEKMDARYANYSYKIDCADGESLWVNKDGWMYHPKNSELRDTISEFIKAVNEANLGIEIKETSIE